MLSEKPWKPDLVIRLFAALLAGFVLGALVVQGYQSQIGNKTELGRLVVFILGVLSFHGVGLVLVHVFIHLHGTTWREAFGFGEPRLGRSIFLAVLVAIIVMPIALSLRELSAKIILFFSRFDIFVRIFGNSTDPQEVVRLMQHANPGLEIAIYGLMTVFLVPFVEEVIFRGILYPALKQSGHRKLALWGTSIFFAWTHGNLPAFLPLVVIAVLLTLLYETTNNLLAPIITHSLFNLTNFAFLIWQNQHPGL